MTPGPHRYARRVMADPAASGAVLDVPALAKELGERFAAAGHELYLVGGSVRDLVLSRRSPDLDFTTSAHPSDTTAILRGWADRQYLVGVTFGTVGAMKQDERLEITTFRQEVYAEEHRKPSVTFGKDLDTDLSRRDFTINAMAIALPDGAFVDPYGGIRHLAAKVLDTPLDPEVAFTDDPLRMVRAARFVAQLDVTPDAAGGGRDARDARAAGDRLGRTHPRRARQVAGRTRSRQGVGAPRRDRRLRRVPARTLGDAARTGPRAPSQGRAAPHLRRRRADRTRPDVAHRGAAPRRREARHPRDHRRRRAVPPPRDGGRAHGGQAHARTPLPQPHDRRRPHVGGDAPAVPRVRRRMERCRGAPLRARRGPTARPAQSAHPRGLHHAQREEGGAVRTAAGRIGRADRAASPSRRTWRPCGPR